MNSTDLLSIVVPCYNEEEVIDIFYNNLIENINEIPDIDYEIIFIDDGSTDKSIDKIKLLKNKNKKISYISFSKNFGKEAAMYAGLQASKGNLLVIMDADLQHPPRIIKQMYHEIKNNDYDIIATKRDNRKGEPIIRSFFSNLFYKLINKVSDVKIIKGAMDFRMMKRIVAEAILDLKEYNRFTKGIYEFVGFKTKWITIHNEKRAAGISSWSSLSLLKYSINGILSFSVFPLTLISVLGVIISIISFIFITYTILEKIIIGNPTSGYASTISILCFLGGLQIFVMGIIGQYIAKIYLETKCRPIYIVREKG